MTRSIGHNGHSSATGPPILFKTESSDLALTLLQCLWTHIPHDLQRSLLSYIYHCKDLMKAMDPFFPPKYIGICVCIFCSAYHFLEFINSFKFIRRRVTPTPHVKDPRCLLNYQGEKRMTNFTLLLKRQSSVKNRQQTILTIRSIAISCQTIYRFYFYFGF